MSANRMAVASIVILAIVGVAAAAAGPPAGTPPKAPSVKLKDLDGRAVQIDYKAHKLTLVNFWATWCVPCREEMPQIARLVEANKAQGLQAFGIALESGKPDEVKRFLKQNPDIRVNYPILIGDDEVAVKFSGVEVVPTTLLIDSTGAIVKRYEGVTSDFFDRVGRDIRAILKPAADAATP